MGLPTSHLTPCVPNQGGGAVLYPNQVGNIFPSQMTPLTNDSLHKWLHGVKKTCTLAGFLLGGGVEVSLSLAGKIYFHKSTLVHFPANFLQLFQLTNLFPSFSKSPIKSMCTRVDGKCPASVNVHPLDFDNPLCLGGGKCHLREAEIPFKKRSADKFGWVPQFSRFPPIFFG